MKSVDFVGMRDGTRSFGRKATADHRFACLFYNVYMTFERLAKFASPTFNEPCGRVLKCDKTERKEQKLCCFA